LWNFQTDAWESVGSAVVGTDRLFAKIAQDPGDDYCLACHDGSPPDGVTFPASVFDIGPAWTGSGWATDRHGDSPGTGFGGGMRSGYARGMTGLPCGACHESHGNDNPYHIREQINGVTVDINTGNDYKYLCAGCHTGSVATWHQPCVDCHADPFSPMADWHWSDFASFGGLLDSPETGTEVGYPNDSSDCSLCHTHGSRTNVDSRNGTGVIGNAAEWCDHWCHEYERTF
jgi:hypothetical protein